MNVIWRLLAIALVFGLAAFARAPATRAGTGVSTAPPAAAVGVRAPPTPRDEPAVRLAGFLREGGQNSESEMSPAVTSGRPGPVHGAAS